MKLNIVIEQSRIIFGVSKLRWLCTVSISVLFFNGLCLANADSLRENSNQLWVQLFGSNFFARRPSVHYDYIAPISIGYSRKITIQQTRLKLSAGVGLGGCEIDHLLFPRYENCRVITLPVSVFWKIPLLLHDEGQRNSLWLGLSTAAAIGPQRYDYSLFHTYYVYETNFTYSWNPELSYELQSVSKKTSIAISWTPKVFVDHEKHGTWFYYSGFHVFLPYGGIALNYQW